MMSMEKVKKIQSAILKKVQNTGHKIVQTAKIPHAQQLPVVRTHSIKEFGSMLFRHKFLAGGAVFSFALVLFMAVAIYRGYFMTAADTTQQAKAQNSAGKAGNSIASSKPSPSSPSPSDSPPPSGTTVLGASSDSGSDDSDDTDVAVSPSVEVSPVPTDIPEPTEAPVDDSSDDDSSSGNSNCTTGSGVPNSWYSDVYPNPPISTSNGSVTLIVNIRDCSINDVSASSNLKISLSSGDPNTLVDGHTLPYNITTQNGQVSFTVTSQVNGTVVLTILDTTDSFTVTDTSNSNPSIDFSGSSATPAPTQSATPTPVQSVSPAPTVSSSPPTPTP